VHDWEIEMVTFFFNLLYSIRLIEVVRIGSAGSPLKGRHHMLRPLLVFLSFGRVYGKIRSTKVVFFVWTIVLERIQTLDNLRGT
jgi:hypothetical protein